MNEAQYHVVFANGKQQLNSFRIERAATFRPEEAERTQQASPLKRAKRRVGGSHAMRSLFLRMARDDALIERTSEPISRGLFAMHPAPNRHTGTVSSDALRY